MQVLNKLFFGIKPSWWKVIAFAVVTGVATGLIMMIPQLEGTFVRNIGETVEAWILFALIVCMNCEKPLEAALKTFVFFLVSQPLVYLTMWPVYQSFPWHYYQYWFYWTLACFPLGALANYAKRGGVVGALVISAACGLLAYLGVGFAQQAVLTSPTQAVAALFCLAQIIVYVLVFFHKAFERIIVVAVSVVVAVVTLFGVALAGPNSSGSYPLPETGSYSAAVADESIATVTVDGTSDFTVNAKGYGTTVLTLTRSDGTTFVYDVTIDNSGLVTATLRQ